MRSDRLRLLDVLEQIDYLTKFALRGESAFLEDEVLQSAILHRLTLLGEACRGLSADLRAQHSETPWPQMIAFRNVVVHQYFGIDLDLVWTIVATDLAPLRRDIVAILANLPE
jgi:uncharacterized protein with HEPN domain